MGRMVLRKYNCKRIKEKCEIIMKHVVEKEFSPILMGLFQTIKENGLDLVIDGIPAFNPKAQFLGGKIINAGSYTALELIKDEESLQTLGDMIRMVSHMEMRTWGILNSLMGLYRLKEHNLLEEVVDTETLEFLKQCLDWRTFVDEKNHYALINKPTNYYGVAFGIARYRELLNWEPVGHSTHLLNRWLEHIDQFSGELGFMDETQGYGRFDRYTMVTPGEITALLINTGLEVPDKIQQLLKQSCKLILQLVNEDGHGCPYGRSNGAYGDTAVLEALSAAAGLGGILSDEEMEIAYGYCISIMNKIAHFWYDSESQAANFWDKGRRTDSYRNKNRILGASLNLSMHVISCYEHWEKSGWAKRKVCSDYTERLDNLTPYTFVTFADGQYQRALAIVRDDKHIWSLPLVNGGPKYYKNDQYLHIPFQNHVLEGVPEYSHAQLIPQLVMENGDTYIPLVYTTQILPQIDSHKMSICCKYEALCLLGDEAEKLEGSSAEVIYTFENHQIHRVDRWNIETNHSNVKEVRLLFLTYSTDPSLNGNKISFKNGTIKSIEVSGFDVFDINETRNDGIYYTPHGRLASEIIWHKKISSFSNELQFEWTINY